MWIFAHIELSSELVSPVTVFMKNFRVSDECVQPTVDVIKKCYSGMKIECSCLQEIYNVSTKLVLFLLCRVVFTFFIFVEIEWRQSYKLLLWRSEQDESHDGSCPAHCLW